MTKKKARIGQKLIGDVTGSLRETVALLCVVNLHKFSTAIFFALLLHPPLGIGNPMLDGNTPVDVCDLARLKGTCKPAPLSVEDNMRTERIPIGKVQFKRTLSLPAQPPKSPADACDAHITISYYQAGDRIKVDTEVENKACVASHGEYSLRIRTIDRSGNSSTRSFSELWSRAEPGSIGGTTFYSMGGAERLLWVRVNSNRKTACICSSRAGLE